MAIGGTLRLRIDARARRRSARRRARGRSAEQRPQARRSSASGGNAARRRVAVDARDRARRARRGRCAGRGRCGRGVERADRVAQRRRDRRARPATGALIVRGRRDGPARARRRRRAPPSTTADSGTGSWPRDLRRQPLPRVADQDRQPHAVEVARRPTVAGLVEVAVRVEPDHARRGLPEPGDDADRSEAAAREDDRELARVDARSGPLQRPGR